MDSFRQYTDTCIQKITPLLSHTSNQPDIRAYSSPSLIHQDKQILDFEKRLEVLEDKEESNIDSGT